MFEHIFMDIINFTDGHLLLYHKKKKTNSMGKLGNAHDVNGRLI